MQGTRHVRSLIRLFIGAVLLCLAWVVLTSGHASAAERPAPAQPRSELASPLSLVDTKGLEGVVGDLLGVQTKPAAHPAAGAPKPATTPAAPKDKASAQKPSGTTTSAPKPLPSKPVAAPAITPLATLSRALDKAGLEVVPLIGGVDQAARSTVDAGLVLATTVTDVVASVPTVGEPVVQIVDGVVAVVGGLPAVGVPSPIVPLPVGAGTPTPTVPSPGGTAVQTGRNPLVPPTGRLLESATIDRAASTLQVSPTHSPDGTSARATSGAVLDGNGSPRGPWTLLDTAPAVPAQPSPGSSGAGPATGDPATTTPNLVLPNPSLFGRSSADWRVPSGLPAQPGTRPD